jgi:hypothetical protein
MGRILESGPDFLADSRDERLAREKKERAALAIKLLESGIEGLGSKDLDKFHQKAEEILAPDRINPRGFTLYDAKIIQGDEEKVNLRKQQFREKNDQQTRDLLKYSTTLEAIINQRIQLSDWLGSDVDTRKTCEYDDIFNGIDIIAEFKNQERSPSLLGLGVDISFSTDIRKKISRIKHEIEQGTLGEIKYFESETSGFQGRQTNVPRVVIGVDQKRLLDLMAKWYTGKTKELDSHPAQIIFVEEILLQLATYRDYAQKIGQGHLVSRYEEIIKLIEQVKEDKKNAYQEIRQNNPGFIEEDDRFYRDLTSLMENFKDIKTE